MKHMTMKRFNYLSGLIDLAVLNSRGALAEDLTEIEIAFDIGFELAAIAEGESVDVCVSRLCQKYDIFNAVLREGLKRFFMWRDNDEAGIPY